MRAALATAVTVATALCAGLFGSHLVLGDGHPLTAALHATTGYWAFGAPLLAILAAALRRWRVFGGAAILTAVAAAWILPGTGFGASAPPGAALRLVSANVLMVNPEPDALLAEVFAGSPDVVVLEEYSPPFAAAAERYHEAYPFRVEHPEEHSFGEAVFSRLPLERVDEEDAGAPVLDVAVRVEGRLVRILVVHTLPPISAENVARWQAELVWLAQTAAAMDPDEALVVAGDLNATRFHPSFRALVRDGGLRDAHAEVGRALDATWPNGRFWFPPLPIDHLLLRGPVRAAAMGEGTGPGSDHRPLLADLRVAP